MSLKGKYFKTKLNNFCFQSWMAFLGEICGSVSLPLPHALRTLWYVGPQDPRTSWANGTPGGRNGTGKAVPIPQGVASCLVLGGGRGLWLCLLCFFNTCRFTVTPVNFTEIPVGFTGCSVWGQGYNPHVQFYSWWTTAFASPRPVCTPIPRHVHTFPRGSWHL